MFFKLKYLPILHGGNLPYRLKKYPKLSSLVFKNSYMNIAPSRYLKYEFEQKGFKTVLIPNVIPIHQYPYKERKKIAPKLEAICNIFIENQPFRRFRLKKLSGWLLFTPCFRLENGKHSLSFQLRHTF